MNTPLLLAYLLTVLLLIATPGPVVALVVDTASRQGTRQAMATALGTNAGSLVLIGVAAYLIVASVAIDPRLLNLLGLAGCLFIARMALDSLSAARHQDAPHTAPAATGKRRGGAGRGFVMGISNPKDILFFLAFFPQFLQVTRSLEHSLVLLSLVWVAVDLLVLGAWILIARRLVRHTGSRLISLGTGVALLLIALAGLVWNSYELFS